MMQTWPSQQSTPYGAWVGSTLVVYQEWREGCTDGLFFASGTSGAGAVWGYGGTGVDDTKQHSRRRVMVTIYNVRKPTTAQ
jgi:hypothetical protein